ncbi:MAG: hypothetical protein H7Z12_08045 [Rhodospirillaceae bacterium]|nr:hypothetical protein [Rhodospirillales bacterium]
MPLETYLQWMVDHQNLIMSASVAAIPIAFSLAVLGTAIKIVRSSDVNWTEFFIESAKIIVSLTEGILRTFVFFDRPSRRSPDTEFAKELSKLRKIKLDANGDIILPPQNIPGGDDIEKAVRARVASAIAEVSLTATQIDELVTEGVKKTIEDALIGDETSSMILRNVADNSYKINADALRSTVVDEVQASAKTKRLMVNLFIVVSTAVFVFNYSAILKFDETSAIGAAIVYIGLSCFIFYIFRVANNRSSVALAILEDTKKHADALNYVLSAKSKGGVLSEHDISALRLILLNRAEREKGATHPYELILNGISNSTIMFKGGRVEVEKKPPAEKS